ncbi:hypothetical protein B566_EDAN011303 [Ephemera danica]|nr:hypothetical protein B566_EDAN011303 [Ephemera danica]
MQSLPQDGDVGNQLRSSVIRVPPPPAPCVLNIALLGGEVTDIWTTRKTSFKPCEFGNQQQSQQQSTPASYGSVVTNTDIPVVPAPPNVTSLTGSAAGTYMHTVSLPLGLEPRDEKHNGHSHERRESLASSQGDHCHRYRGDPIDYRARRKLITASVLCLLFMIAEIVGGWLSNSLAIATDAAHLLTDFASFMISLFSLWVSARPPTRRMSFGWYRAEVLGALTSVLMIWVVTAILVYMAVLRIIHDDYEIDAKIMLITSGAGVAVNIIMGATLHQHGHSHHTHSHSSGAAAHTVDLDDDEEAQGLLGDHHVTKDEKHTKAANINVRAAFIHVVGDLIQSIGVFAAALTIFFKPEWRIVDPICTFLFSVLVLMTTMAIIRDTMQVLMEAMPKGLEFSEVLDTLKNSEGVLQPNAVTEKVLRSAEAAVRSRFTVFEMTLQVEPFEQSMDCCDQCLCPEK